MDHGHLAIGLAEKSIAPKAPLWSLLIASEVIDALCLGLIAEGVENQGVLTTDIATASRC